MQSRPCRSLQSGHRVLTASVKPAMVEGRARAAPASAAVQLPSAAPNAVLEEALRSISAGSQDAKAGEFARLDRLVAKGMPAGDRAARCPDSTGNTAPGPRMTEERKAVCVGFARFLRGGGLGRAAPARGRLWGREWAAAGTDAQSDC
jgi:hypothetical protein